MNILLTTHHLKDFGGSELNILDLASVFKDRGDNVVVSTFMYGDPVAAKFKEKNIKVYDLRRDVLPDIKYDFYWCQHSPTLYYSLYVKKIQADYVLFNCLSPNTPLEVPPINSKELSLIMGISYECREKYHEIDYEFCNSVYYKKSEQQNRDKLDSILVVTNHLQDDLKDALKIISGNNISVTHWGFGGKYEYLEPSSIVNYSAVISIGRTVQYGLMYKVPVYNYDKFGGVGWITQQNIFRAGRYNFSGRDCNRKIPTNDIVTEILSGYDEAKNNVSTLRLMIGEQYNLAYNVHKVCNYLLTSGKKFVYKDNKILEMHAKYYADRL